MNLEEANLLRDNIRVKLLGYKAYTKVVPKSNNEFQVLVVQQGKSLPVLPDIVRVVPGRKFEPQSSISPSYAVMDLEKPLSPANRATEPSDDFRWRSREIQDIVKRVAMSKYIVHGIEVLADKARRDARVDTLLESLHQDLLLNGCKITHPSVRLLYKVQRGYRSDVADALVVDLLKRYPEASGFVTKAKHIRNLLRDVKSIAPEEVKQRELAVEAAALMREVDKSCARLAGMMTKLKLGEEAHQLRSMAASAKDIYKVLNKLID